MCFPENACGPDLVYRYKDKVYIVQVKLVQRLPWEQAAQTTHPDNFYRQRKPPGSIIRGYESLHAQVKSEFARRKYHRI